MKRKLITAIACNTLGTTIIVFGAGLPIGLLRPPFPGESDRAQE